jgi:hypothetical protein
MPIPWLTVLKVVPWTDVITNAPKVAEGARKLWHSVSGKAGDTSLGQAGPSVPASAWTDASGPELPARLTRLEGQLMELRGQIRASSELIDALASQNTQLIRHVEAQDRRLRRLSWGTGVLAVTSLSALILALAD